MCPGKRHMLARWDHISGARVHMQMDKGGRRPVYEVYVIIYMGHARGDAYAFIRGCPGCRGGDSMFRGGELMFV
jgi:hypothetical protein